jgi:anti-sigma B factor antagonist
MIVTAKTRQAGDVTVVDLAGRVTVGPSANSFADTIRKLSAAGHKNLLLNFADISYMDSSGLGELVASLTAVTKGGGSMKLLKPSKRVEEILQITKVNTLFQVFDDEAAAVKSFA